MAWTLVPTGWYADLWTRIYQVTVADDWPELNWTRTVFGQPYIDLLGTNPGTDLTVIDPGPPASWIIDNDDEGPFALPAGTYWLIVYDSSPTMPTVDPTDGFDDFTDGLGAPAVPFSDIVELLPVVPESLTSAPSTRQRSASCLVVADPPIDPVPDGHPPVEIHRHSWHYDPPTFTDGWKEPQQAKSLIVHNVRGRYRVIIGDTDRSFFRGVQVEVLRWSHSSLFGPETLTLRFAQISPFEEPGTGDLTFLHDQKKVHLRWIKADGTRDPDWHWCGVMHNPRPVWTEDGYAVEVEVKGYVHQGSDATNRPTNPAGAQDSHDIGDRIPHRLNQIIGRKFARIRHVTTGITQWRKGALTETVLSFVTQLLGIAWTDDGLPWMLIDRPGKPWQAHLTLPDPDTVDYTLALGTEGVDFLLDEDNDEQANVVFGEWINVDGNRTQNLKYPHLRPDASPAWPLALGSSFVAGDAQTGFRKFAKWLERNGYTIYSDDTYDARDVDEVKDAQDRMGLAETGIVDENTWGTAFETGAAEGNFRDAVYLPVAWDKRVEPYLWTPDGQRIGRNPDYDPSIPRREITINFGERAHRDDVKRAARQIVARSKKLSLVGTIRTKTDPEECSFRDMRAGRTLAVPYLYGTGAGGVKFHIAHVEVVEDTDEPYAELQVDTLWRDAWTVRQIIERNREARRNPARLASRGKASELTSDTQQVIDADNGAGHVYPHAVTAGDWRVVPIPAGAWGTFIRVKATTDPITSYALMLFSSKVSSRFCNRYVPAPLDVKRPYHEHASELKAAGLLQAWGSSVQPCGYSKADASDGYLSEDDPLTGRFEWDSSIEWHSDRTPILWLAEWVTDATELEIRFYPEPVTF